MKVLVTGTAGRVGGAIHRRLAREHAVVGLDRLPASTVDLVGDVGDAVLLRRALRGVEAVVHTAALHAPNVGSHPDAEFLRINVEATELLARLAFETGVRRFVFTSSTALYGAANTAGAAAAWVDEALTPRPTTIYHRSKLLAEAALAGCVPADAALTILRMSRCFPEPAPMMAAYRLHRGIDLRDVAEAHALALADAGPGLRRYVISAATPFLLQDAAELLSDAPAVLRRRAPALVAAFGARGWELPRSIDRVYVPDAAIAALGWRPRYGFEEVLRQLDEGSAEVLRPADGG